MNKKENNLFQKANRNTFILLLFLILSIYSNSFHVPFHFDDYRNIVHDNNIHIDNLSMDALSNSIYLNNSEKIERPLSRLTFAVNWYLSGDRVGWYHVVNIIIHLMTSYILFLLVYHIFATPVFLGKAHSDKYFIAFLTAVFWAINPIQTQAVTYIVQRMTSMATLFYALCMLCYLKARLCHYAPAKRALFLCCGVSCFLAFASKESAATLPFALILLEAVFFQDLTSTKTRRNLILLSFIAGILIFALGYFIFLNGNITKLFAYNDRFISSAQRLLTEPRVLIFYLSQIFYPVPTRLSIEHDMPVSVSLFEPWTTLFCIIAVAVFVIFAFRQLRKTPLLSFAILFFFLTHSIEASLADIELVFEHRNYLPSLFLFLPVAVGTKMLMDHYQPRSLFMARFLTCFLICLLIGLGTGTYIRNMVWGSAKTLWTDAIKKAPNVGRPYYNLASHYYERKGDYKTALILYHKALNLKMLRKTHKALPYYSMAKIYDDHGDYNKAKVFYIKALEIQPRKLVCRYRLARVLEKLGDWEEALTYIDDNVLQQPDNFDCLKLKGMILLKHNRTVEAFNCFSKAVKQHPDQPEALKMMGIGFRSIGQFYKAKIYFKQALVHKPDDTMALLYLADVNLKTNNMIEADQWINALLKSLSVDQLLLQINEFFTENFIQEDELHILISKIEERMAIRFKRNLLTNQSI